MISRFTVYVSGSKAEDILSYGRTHEMFTRLMPESVRRNLASSSGYSATTGDHHGNTFDVNAILAHSAVRWTHKAILSGICNSGKYMPLQFLGAGGLVLEWELGNAGDGVNTTATTVRTGIYLIFEYKHL